jgi:excisionase family DNA binding protein
MVEVNGKQFFTTVEIAQVMGYSRQRIWQIIQEGKLPAPLIIGRAYLIPGEAALAFVARMRKIGRYGRLSVN